MAVELSGGLLELLFLSPVWGLACQMQHIASQQLRGRRADDKLPPKPQEVHLFFGLMGA